ncbi:MAG: hypothetical protein WC343_03735 [Bacilli bacterium]|jgi:hypothetical protein
MDNINEEKINTNKDSDKETNSFIKDINVFNKNIISDVVTLNEETKNKLSFDLASDISDCINDKNDIMKQLDELRASIHIEADTDNQRSDLDGSSNYRDTLTSSHIKIVSSILKRTMVANPVWLINLPFQKEYERWLNDSFAYCTWNYLDIEKKLRDAVDLAVKEFVSFVEVYDYVDERYENVIETYLTGQLLEFRVKYPNYQSLGLKNRKEYKELLNKMAIDIDTLGEAKITLYKKITEHKIDLEVRSIDEVFILSWDSTSIDTAKGVFSRVLKTNSEIMEASRIGYYDEEASERVINSPMTNLSNESDYKQSMDERFYLEKDVSKNVRPIYQGVYNFILDEKIGEEEFYIHFDYYTKEILRIERYQRIQNMRNIIPFSIMPEHNRIFGSCLAKDLENTQSLIDTMYNQIIDNNHLANQPIFKASLEEANTADSSLYKRRLQERLDFSPGLTLFLKKPSDFSQMQTSALDLSSMMNLINMAQRSAEGMDGAVQLLSGRENPADPTAPAKKTEMQLSQSTLRMDDYVRDLRPSLNKLGQILLYKYVNIQPQEWKKYQVMFSDANQESVDKVAMRPQDLNINDIVIDVKGQSITKNKDSITRELQFVLGFLMQVPQLQQAPKTIYILLDKFLSNLEYSRNEIDNLLAPLKMMADMQDRQAQQPNIPSSSPNIPQPPSLPIEIINEANRRGLKIEQPINNQKGGNNER